MARLCFHRHLWFCSQGGVLQTLPQPDTPLGRHPLPERHTHPWADTPLARNPPARHPHPRPEIPWPDTTPAWDDYCSGWYTSYWNGFLFNPNISVSLTEIPKTETPFPEGTWDQAARQELKSWRPPPPLPLRTDWLTLAYENITLPQTSFVGGKYQGVAQITLVAQSRLERVFSF